MKKIILSIAFISVVTLSISGQYKLPDATSYSQPLQIDSSDFYIIGTLVDKTNKTKYNFGPTPRNYWTNVLIYNSSNNQTKKIFSTRPILVYQIVNNYISNTYSTQQNYSLSAVIRKHIIYIVRSDEYNKDGVIDEDDPFYLFVSSKSGNNLSQITPKDTNVISWTLSKDNKTILVKLQKDQNGDKKFTDEDEALYQIDLNDDISKIKIYPVNL